MIRVGERLETLAQWIDIYKWFRTAISLTLYGFGNPTSTNVNGISSADFVQILDCIDRWQAFIFGLQGEYPVILKFFWVKF